MDPIDLLRATAALFAVLGLLAASAWLLRRTGLSRKLGEAPGGRLCVVETRWLDPRTRLLLIRRDRTEHLLLLGAGPPLLVERGIAAPTAREAVR